MNNLDFISDVIYALKQEYGDTGTVVSIVSVSSDIDSGVIIRTVQSKPVLNMIFLPNVLARRFFKQTTAYDIRNRAILIDYADIGSLELKPEDYVLYDNKSWQINTVEDFESRALILEVTEFLGYPPESITDISDTLTLEDENGLS